MTIPTIPDHLHTWQQYEYEDDLGQHTRATCLRCDDTRFRVYMPGSLRNKVTALARKKRHALRKPELPS